jgi:hypothetical protein
LKRGIWRGRNIKSLAPSAMMTCISQSNPFFHALTSSTKDAWRVLKDIQRTEEWNSAAQFAGRRDMIKRLTWKVKGRS